MCGIYLKTRTLFLGNSVSGLGLLTDLPSLYLGYSDCQVKKANMFSRRLTCFSGHNLVKPAEIRVCSRRSH